MSKMAKELRLIPITNIIANKNQPRRNFDANSIEELAQSIRAVGIIQPLSVRETDNDVYLLISGERRLRAAKIAGLDRVPCVILKADQVQLELMTLVENIQREDLNFFEEARAYTKLMETYGFTQSQLAEKVGKKQSTISNKLRLLRLGDETMEVILQNKLTERHARALLQIPEESQRLSALQQIIKKDFNVRQTEELVDKMKREVMLNSQKKNIKNIFNYKIYTNTIKQAYDSIKKTGIDAGYAETQYEDRVEVKIVIPLEK
ncbi:MAG: ParB/RepB/Spo0J family partition protein [Eubacteriaceae bacterium]|jgi:ParB family chromosome partitioning protein|nr:ParB/RepB/Spo0J family partition protein [Eubacteriaceae bacterium]